MINKTRVFLTLLLLLPLIATISSISRPVSAAGAAQWTPLNMPTEGTAGKWTLAGGSDIRCLTMAGDGTLYCYANPSGTSYTLFKSTDAGRSWTAAGKVTDVIVDIAVSPQDNTNIYYATASRVFKSVDTGNVFTAVTGTPGGAGAGNVSITSLDVVHFGNANLVAVSTVDADAAQFGGVYLLDESQNGNTWVNANIGNLDVYRAAFSPNYSNDRQIVAIASDETNTFVSSKIVNSNWGQTLGTARINAIVPAAASIAFPDGYNGTAGNAVLFAGIDTGANGGDVFQVTQAAAPAASAVKDLKIGSRNGLNSIDVGSLAVSGSTIFAGCARSAWVYLSTDGGASWAQNSKPPTGQSDTCLIIAPDFTNRHKVYAVTRGTESAFSYSADGGLTWNQISLIDTKISDITDIATPSATTIFMLTFNNTNLKQSLWRTADGGATWDRVLCSSVSGFDSLNLIRPVPQYSADSPLIIIAGQANGNPVIWTSADNGQNITGRTAPCNIDTLAIVDSSTWFVSGYDGSKDQVYQTADGGNTYTLPTEAGVQPLAAITLSPSYGQDKTILAGNIVGQVFISQDNGANFSLVGSALPLVSGAGRVSVAFDCSFGQNRIIYAATDAKVSAAGKDRIFRFALGQSTAWKSITSSLPDAAVIKQVVIGDDGTLYALNAEPLSAADTKGGVLRALNPTSSAPTFETMLAGFEDGVTLNKMSFCGNQLYVVDTKNMRLAKFVDTLTSPPALVSPEDKATGLDTTGLNLKFEAVDGAGGYEWQVSDNASFSGLLTGLTGTSDSSSASVSGLTPAATYYWRVRVNSPYLSRWSDTWLFYTMLGGTNVVPLLSVPQAGAITGVKPVFQWSTINAATKYDLLVAADTDFTDIVIDKTGDNAVNSNAWESDIVLKNTTTYYWKVKARSDKSYGGWSAVSAFTTVPATVTTTTAAVTSTTDPTPTTATTASTAVIATPAETTLISTSTLIVQLPGTTQPVNVNVSIPHWIIYGGIGLSAIIVVTLAVLVVATIRRRH